MIIAGTGHRPQFCPCGFVDPHPWIDSLKNNMSDKLKLFNVKIIISGGAIGLDTWIAELALHLEIPLHMYVPFKTQGSNWPAAARKRYDSILERATVIRYVSEDYSKGAFLKRDRAMVDAADHIFSLLNPLANSGGTYYTVEYAKEKNKPVTNFWTNI